VFKEFRDFLLRGNVIELAVAVVIGAAFGAVITSFTGDILTPLLSPLVPDGKLRLRARAVQNVIDWKE